MVDQVDELNLRERNDLIVLEMAAMFMLKDDSRYGFLTRWGTVGLVIVGLAMEVPLFAQQAEYDSLQMFVPRDQIETLVEYQSCFLSSATTRPAPTVIGLRYRVTGFPGGLKSGAISNWVRSSILPPSATER